MSLLISEPPLVVLPSLAREVGLTDAIVLQQLHYAGMRTEDGWIVRSAADWSRALRGVIAARTMERIFAKLLEGDWVESRPEPGKPTAYRVAPRMLREVVPATGVGSPPASSGGTVSREEKQEKKTRTTSSKKTIKPEDEMIGFAAWLGHHSVTAELFDLSVSVPRATTSARTDLHTRYAKLRAEGYSEEEMHLASEGVLSSDWHRENGHTRHLTVLRQPEKLHERIDAGRAWRAEKASGGGKYGHLDG